MPRDPDPSNLEAHLGYWLRMVSNAVSRSFAGKLEGAGVTVAEWVLLRTLYGAGKIAPSDLAARMGMTRGAISKLADRLLDKGLIERQPNPGDGRAHTLCLGPVGRDLVPQLADLADRNDAEHFGVLDADDRRHFEILLRKIIADRNLAGPPVD